MKAEDDDISSKKNLERLTANGRRVLWKAEVEATTLGQNSIGALHIFIAILRSPETAAARVLQSIGFDLESLTRSISNASGHVETRTSGRLQLSAEGRNVLQSAALEAERMGIRFIGTEHLLLGVLANTASLNKGPLKTTGLDLRAIRRQIKATYQPGARSRDPDSHSQRRPRKERERTLLTKHGTDLTSAARTGHLDPVVGRNIEIDRAIEILLRRSKNNPMLIGDAGVGKTAIVEGLAHRITNGNVPAELLDQNLVSLNLPSVIAGTKYRGDFEDRMQKLMHEIRARQDVIVVIDEIHTIVGAGGLPGSLDAANMLKSHLARGEIQVVGATTWNDYRRYIANDKSLTRRFQTIHVDEPNDVDTVAILNTLTPIYESYHGVNLTTEALKTAVRLSQRYMPSRQLPDKAIDLVDEAAARAKVLRLTPPDRILELERRIKEFDAQLKVVQAASSTPNLDETDSDVPSPDVVQATHQARSQVADELRDERAAWSDEIDTHRPIVGPNEVANVLSAWTGIPVPSLVSNDGDRFMDLETQLQKRIVGQDEALNEMGRSLRRAMAGMRDQHRPIGSFLCVGSSGVGKTESARALAEFVSGTEENLVRMDMSGMSESHNVSRLIGSPPGYIGHDEATELTDSVRRNPFSVVLFDDIDKAHPRTLQILLQIMEDGSLKDSSGPKIDFRNTVIILTSNLGNDIFREPTLGFRNSTQNAQCRASYETRMREHARRHLPSEFLNRIDRLLVFTNLEEEHIREIARRQLSAATVRAEKLSIQLHVTSEALDYIVGVAVERHSGARPIARLVQQYVDQPLTDCILRSHASDREFELRILEGTPTIVEITSGTDSNTND